jgi:hypothetical protein
MHRSFALSIPILLSLAACQSKGATRAESYSLGDLPCASGDATAWESTPLPDLTGEAVPGCEWLPFPGRTLVEIEHDLGRAPLDVSIYISFKGEGESSTKASGDPGRIVGADETRVLVENTTEQDFFLRVVVR